MNTATGAKGRRVRTFVAGHRPLLLTLRTRCKADLCCCAYHPPLSPFAEYSDSLKANTVPYAAIVTKVGFEKDCRIPSSPSSQAGTDRRRDRLVAWM